MPQADQWVLTLVWWRRGQPPVANRQCSYIVSAHPQAHLAPSNDRHAAFPVRVRLHLGPHGLGRTAAESHGWLDDQIGRGSYAVHGGGRAVGGDCVSLYFRTPTDADAWHAAFPQLELADGTRLPGYYSPYLPFGRPPVEDDPVCNLYNQTRGVDAMRQLFAPLQLANRAGNLEPGEIYPDRLAPIIRHAEGGGFELVLSLIHI